MASNRNNLYNELREKDTILEQFNRTDKRFKLDVEYIQESSAEDASNNLVIESSLNNIQLIVGPTKNIEIFGNLIVKESINLRSVIVEDASINLNASIGGSLTVNGDVSLNKNVNIKENLEVLGDSSTNNLLVNGRADISENLYVNGDVSFQINLDVYGKTITTDLTIINDTCLNNNVAIGRNLDVSNIINSQFGIIHADFIAGVPGSKINGSTSILSRLQAVGDSSFTNNVFIAGGINVGTGTATELTSFHNDVYFTKNVQLGLDPNSFLIYDGNFSVYYDSSFDSNVSISRNLNVGATDISESLNVDGNVSLNSNVDISSQLIVNGDVSLNKKLDVLDNVNLIKKLVVSGDVSLNANVDISGLFKINNLVVSGDTSYNLNVDISNRLVVNGDISLNNSVDISNNLKIGNKVIIGSDVSLNSSLDISNDLNVNNKLLVKSDVSLNKNVDITENLNVVGDLSINLNVKIGNKLIVSSDISLNSSVDISNDLNVNNKLIVNGDVSLNNNVDILENLTIGGNITIDGATVIVGNLQANNVTFGDFSATNIIVNENTIEIGKNINSTNPVNIAIGSYAGHLDRGNDTTAIGRLAGNNFQNTYGIAIGTKSGENSQNINAIAIGTESGSQEQGENSIAIGEKSGYDTQGANGISIGKNAGYTNQSENAIAIGNTAGNNYQSIGSIGIGYSAGNSDQGTKSIAIGYASGNTNQGVGSIGIGNEAGNINQGAYSIGIGYSAGKRSQSTNSIILNAVGTALSADSSGLYVDPIRYSVDTKKNVMQYDTSTKELIYGEQINISGTITSSDISCASLTVAGLIDTQNNDLSMGSGTIVCKRVTVNEMTINGDISLIKVDVLETFNALGDVNLLSRMDVTNDVSLNSSLDVNNRLVVYGEVSLNGIVDIADDLVVRNNVHLLKKLVVGTDASFLGNLDVLGQLGTSDIKLTGDVSFQENVDIVKRIVVNNDSSLNGNVTVATNLRVGGRGDIISDLSINNSVTIGGGLDISGLTNLSSLNAKEDLLVGKELHVTRDATFISDVFIGEHLKVDGDVSFQRNVYIQDGNINIGSGKTLDISLGSLILRDKQISGDKINGGTIDEITISKLTGPLDCNNQLLTNIQINNGALDNLSIVKCDIVLTSNNIIDISEATLILKDNQISGDKINGGTIHDISISKLGGKMDCNNEQMSNVNISGGILNSITISNNMFIVDNDSITCISNNMIVDFSLATLVFRNHQISGDKINGGTIDDISISKLGGSMNCNTELMSNVNISGGIVNYISISNSDIFMLGKTIDLSGSNLILKDNEISGDKINGGTIDNITISEIHGPIDFCNQLMTNVNLSGGIINDVAGTLGNIVFTPDSLLDLQAANIIFAPNQLSGDSIGGGTISGITISNLLGAMNCNTQAMTNVNIVSGNLTGVTINGTITIATLDGAMNANNQFISNVNIDSGDISNVNITANSIISSGSITGSSFAIGSANISEAELETIDGITPGTAAASKALVLDSNLNISGIRNITSTGVLDVGNSDLKHYIGKAAIGYLGSTVHMAGFAHRDHASDTNYAMKQDINGGVFLNAPTEKKVRLGINGGETVLVDNSGIGVTGTITASTTIKALDISVNRNLDVSDNLTVSGSIIANGSITGGSFVIGSANISETELETIDGITPGTAAASKALVVDGNVDIAGLRNITATGSFGCGTITTTGQINGPSTLIIDPAGIGDNTGLVVIRGGLQIDGSSTIINSSTLDISDHRILLSSSATNQSQTYGAGIEVSGNKTFKYVNGDVWESNIDLSARGITTTILRATNIDLSLQSLLDTSAAHFTEINANTTLLSATLGIASASKALVVDSNVDISGIRNITTSGSIKGLDISVNRNLDVSNNLTVSGSIIVNGSITGSSFVIGSANITEAELEKIDNISDGSVSSSKAVVVDDNKDIGGFNLLSAITLSGENINIKGKDLYNILDFFLELDSFTS